MNNADAAQMEEAAQLFRVLGNPMRLAIVHALHERSWCVCELAEHLGMNKSITSKHLSLLESKGIIDMRKEGTRVNCVLAMPCVLDMMRCAIGLDSENSEHEQD